MRSKQEVFRARTQNSFKGPDNLFAGQVQVDMLFPCNDTAHYSGADVTFQPGARTAWHLQPAGQHMVVTSGVGLTEAQMNDFIFVIDSTVGKTRADGAPMILAGVLDRRK